MIIIFHINVNLFPNSALKESFKYIGVKSFIKGKRIKNKQKPENTSLMNILNRHKEKKKWLL